jgi:hypothetical protein
MNGRLVAFDNYCFAGACGLAGAAPVVLPGSLLGARGVTSRMPGGAGGGDEFVFCAVAGAGAVAAFCWWVDEWFNP